MTNEDAVNLMGQLRMYISGGGIIDRKLDEAVRMAIDALKELGNQSQEVNNPNDCISRQAAVEGLTGYIDDTGIFNQDKWFVHGIKTAITHLKSLPSAQPTYTDAEVQKMQDMEQTQIEKAFDLGREDAMAEIIHCGECKHADYSMKDVLGRIYCLNHGFYWDALAYCSYAERRTDDH